MDKVIKQIKDKEGYKNINFTIFSFIENDGFVPELDSFSQNTTGITDYEWKIIEISDQDRKNILNKHKETITSYNNLKHHIEKVLQTEPTKLRLYIKKDKGVVFVVKHIDFNL